MACKSRGIRQAREVARTRDVQVQLWKQSDLDLPGRRKIVVKSILKDLVVKTRDELDRLGIDFKGEIL
jgi:hypothetical protein